METVGACVDGEVHPFAIRCPLRPCTGALRPDLPRGCRSVERRQTAPAEPFAIHLDEQHPFAIGRDGRAMDHAEYRIVRFVHKADIRTARVRRSEYHVEVLRDGGEQQAVLVDPAQASRVAQEQLRFLAADQWHLEGIPAKVALYLREVNTRPIRREGKRLLTVSSTCKLERIAVG